MGKKVKNGIQQLVLINPGKGIQNHGRGILQLVLINPGKGIHNLGIEYNNLY